MAAAASISMMMDFKLPPPATGSSTQPRPSTPVARSLLLKAKRHPKPIITKSTGGDGGGDSGGGGGSGGSGIVSFMTPSVTAEDFKILWGLGTDWPAGAWSEILPATQWPESLDSQIKTTESDLSFSSKTLLQSSLFKVVWFCFQARCDTRYTNNTQHHISMRMYPRFKKGEIVQAVVLVKQNPVPFMTLCEESASLGTAVYWISSIPENSPVRALIPCHERYDVLEEHLRCRGSPYLQHMQTFGCSTTQHIRERGCLCYSDSLVWKTESQLIEFGRTHVDVKGMKRVVTPLYRPSLQWIQPKPHSHNPEYEDAFLAGRQDLYHHPEKFLHVGHSPFESTTTTTTAAATTTTTTTPAAPMDSKDVKMDSTTTINRGMAMTSSSLAAAAAAVTSLLPVATTSLKPSPSHRVSVAMSDL